MNTLQVDPGWIDTNIAAIVEDFLRAQLDPGYSTGPQVDPGYQTKAQLDPGVKMKAQIDPGVEMKAQIDDLGGITMAQIDPYLTKAQVDPGS